MSVEVKIPAVGESITEVVIAEWLKKDGDYVSADDLICEIESDKASFEIPADSDGVLKIRVREGETVAVDSVIAEIDTNADRPGKESEKPAEDDKAASEKEVEQKDTARPEKKASEKEKKERKKSAEAGKEDENSTSYEIRIPSVGESITEVVLSEWLMADGETVSEEDLICEIESDKASFEIPAEQGGVLHHKANEGDTLSIGDVVARIEGGKEGDRKKKSAAGEQQAAEPEDGGDGAPDKKKRVTPVAAKILKEAGVNPDSVSGSGPGDSITKEDALKAAERGKSATERNGKQDAPKTARQEKDDASSAETSDTSAGTGMIDEERPRRRERMSTLRKTIARRLVSAKNQTAMLTTFNEVDLSAVKELRAKYKDAFKERYEVGLGFMSFFARACCLALKEWPAANAQIDDDHILYHDFCDISIAVSSPRGLVVPVIRNADRLSLAEIEKEVLNLAQKARDGKLTIEEMTGGTFTISNGGVFGSLLSTPILNEPQSAILGMHKIEDRPVVIGGEITVRPMMYVALSYDHRIIDGRESVSFLVRVKELLEDPARMLLEI